jgi:hypothetical protein
MKDNYYIARKILARISRKTVKLPAAAGDFLDLGSRMAVDQALSRLVRRKQLIRVGRGLYDVAHISQFTGTAITSSPDDIAKALGRKLKIRILPFGGLAANLLQLSTQVPAKMIYLTDGRGKTVHAGPHTLYFRHVSPKTLAVTGRLAPIVFQALRYLGRKGIGQEEVARLNHLLKKKDKQDLHRNLSNAPQWMKPVLLQIAAADSPVINHGYDSQNFN